MKSGCLEFKYERPKIYASHYVRTCWNHLSLTKKNKQVASDLTEELLRMTVKSAHGKR